VKTHKHYLDFLTDVAENSVRFAEHRVAACIVYKRKIVSVGVNSLRTDPFAAKYQKHPEAIYLHAETAAIKKADRILSKKQLRKSTLYICRLSHTDLRWAMSAPCVGCRRAIIEYELKRVVFTTGANEYDTLINTGVSCQNKQRV